MIFMRMHPTVFYQSTTKDVVYGFQVAGTNVDMINCTRRYDNAEPNYKKAYRPEHSSQ